MPPLHAPIMRCSMEPGRKGERNNRMGTIAAFDEIMGGSGAVASRPELSALHRWLDTTPDTELRRRQQAAEATFRQLGITFAVYGESDASERIIPFYHPVLRHAE